MNKFILKAGKRRLASSLTSFGVTTLAVGVLSAVPAIDAALDTAIFARTAVYAQDDEDGPREPPPTRSSQTLSRQVYTRVEEVMELRDEEDFAGALEVLGEIREMYNDDRLNEREEYTMWLFYASIAQAQENYEEAVDFYSRILEIEGLTQEQIEQTLFYIGQLQYVLERYADAIETLNRYLDVASNPNEDVFLRIGTAHYQLEQYEEAIPYIQRNMEMTRQKGKEVKQSTYGLLRALYLSLEQYEEAREVLQEMVVLFNEPDDWGFLAAINGQLERVTEQAHTYWVAYQGDYLDSESQLMNTAFHLFNNGNPYGAAQVVSQGIEDGIVEETEDNLSFLSQAWQVAREDERAVPPLEQAAAMSDDGDLYNRLGRIYLTLGEYEQAVDAFREALNKGGLDRPDQLYLQLARGLMELNRFDEAITAAQEARNDERSRETASTWVQLLEREKERHQSLQERRERYAEYF